MLVETFLAVEILFFYIVNTIISRAGNKGYTIF